MISESKAWGPAGMGVPLFGCGRTSIINIALCCPPSGCRKEVTARESKRKDTLAYFEMKMLYLQGGL